MDKMLVDTMGDVVITNEGVTILKEMDIEHPAAKMMVEIAKTQDDRQSTASGLASVSRQRVIVVPGRGSGYTLEMINIMMTGLIESK